VVLTLSASSKQVRGEDPLAHVRSRLEDLDIKTKVRTTGSHLILSRSSAGIQAYNKRTYAPERVLVSPLARSKITITDLDSKKGTVVDEKRIQGEYKLDLYSPWILFSSTTVPFFESKSVIVILDRASGDN
jgi:hypothetical protein